MAIQTITVNKFYLNTIRRNKNDIMDHYIPDSTRKHTLPKYISSIDKEFIYVKPVPQTGSKKDPVNKRTLKFNFSGRDTLSITRTNKETSQFSLPGDGRIQLKGVNTNNMNILKTSKYEGISDEDNIFYLTSLLPITKPKTDEGFQFNLWWLGENPIQNTPIGGSLTQNDKLIQNNNISQLTVSQGIIQHNQQPQTIEFKKITPQQKLTDSQILTKKQPQNNLTLSF